MYEGWLLKLAVFISFTVLFVFVCFFCTFVFISSVCFFVISFINFPCDCSIVCFLLCFSFERTVVKVSVNTAQGSKGSYDEDSWWAGGKVPCLHMAGESASADHL